MDGKTASGGSIKFDIDKCRIAIAEFPAAKEDGDDDDDEYIAGWNDALERVWVVALMLREAIDEIARFREIDVERERVRAEDQARRDLLDSYPGHGAG